MKRIVSVVLIAIVLLSFATLLCGCGSSSKSSGSLVGTWNGSWEYQGNIINCSIQFNEDGTYKKESFKNNDPSGTETGTYVLDKSTVILHEGGNEGLIQEYKYKNDTLTNNGHTLTKVNK